MQKAIIRIGAPADTLFSADQIVGKSLIAKKPVNLYRMPKEASPVVYTVPVGAAVGIVYAWIGGNGAPLYWAFYDAQQKPYYAKHEAGLFSIEALKDQGSLNVKEQAEAEKKKEQDSSGSMFPSFPDPFKNINWKPIGYVAGGIAALIALSLLNNLAKK